MDGRQPEGIDLVLRTVRTRGPQTRQDLVAATGLSRSQIDQRLDQLRELGLIEEVEQTVVTGGRRARPIGLRRDSGHVLAISMGVTGVVVGAVGLDGRLQGEESRPIDIAAGPHEVLGGCLELCAELAATAAGKTWAAGIAVPGPVDIDEGIVVSPPVMPGWDGFPIRSWLASRLRVPVWLDNDANVTALGEYRYGAGRGHDDLVYVKLGSGIGAGIIMGGALQHGNGGSAGDIGHLPVPGSATPCRCGNSGCLEAVAGGLALARVAEQLAESGSTYLRRAREQGRLDAASLVRAAEHGDDRALAELHRAGGRIGEVLASVVSLLNPAQLIVGGGLARAGDVLLSSLRKSLYARALPLASRDLLVRRAELGDAGGLNGTAELVLDALFAPALFSQWAEAGSPQGMPELVAGARTLQEARPAP